MGYAANFQNEMQTVKIEAQTLSGVEGNLRTFLTSENILLCLFLLN